MPVPYYDCADNRLLDMLPDAKAERYLSEGIAHAIHSKQGRIMRLYSIAKERVYGTVGEAVAAIHTGSRTIQIIHNESGTRIREYNRPQPMTGSPRNNTPLANLDIGRLVTDKSLLTIRERMSVRGPMGLDLSCQSEGVEI